MLRWGIHVEVGVGGGGGGGESLRPLELLCIR